MMDRDFDVVIIGGGIVGCAIAREFSRYKVNAMLLEKECDVAFGTSGRNSGVAHAGFYMQPGTLKAKTNVEGHIILPELCNDLDVPYKGIGKLVVAKGEDDISYLEELKKQGEQNGTRGLEIIDKDGIKKLEPSIQGVRALHSPTSAILCPFTLTIALAENAIKNGVRFSLNTEVKGIQNNGDKFIVKTNKGEFTSDFVVNSAGLYADRISEMAGISEYKIYPCRGEYHILDRSKSALVNHLIYPVPAKDCAGLGVHLTPTVHGNIMLGPSAEYIGDNEDLGNSADVMNTLYKEAKELLPDIERRDFIRSFAGVRPKLISSGSDKPADFVIKEEFDGFINLVGIESPGLTAAPAIAGMVVDIVKGKKDLELNSNFNPKRKGIVKFNELSDKKKAELIRKNPNYGRVVCRCETITQQEIIDALDNPLGAVSLNSVKNRCRAGMGRCQGGFCSPKIVEIIEEIFKPGVDEITLKGDGSELFTGRVKHD
ncbi:MAG: NAD(P)/FAD-dependent oxidoreductase [Candidatus Altiarchaeales archaeon]|nr:NAD(P)/FAD-dependent oxidoreductase [Candidatus Altiarchaeales archaeon]